MDFLTALERAQKAANELEETISMFKIDDNSYDYAPFDGSDVTHDRFVERVEPKIIFLNEQKICIGIPQISRMETEAAELLIKNGKDPKEFVLELTQLYQVHEPVAVFGVEETKDNKSKFYNVRFEIKSLRPTEKGIEDLVMEII